MKSNKIALAVAVALLGTQAFAAAPGDSISLAPMATGENGWTVSNPLFTVGESFGAYTPPGILDGLGAYELDENTVRVLANHELRHSLGYAYGPLGLKGARVSYFDIDKETRQIVDAGLAYDTIYDANGVVATDKTFLAEPFQTAEGQGPGDGVQLDGFSRFCSAQLVAPDEFRTGGVEDIIFFTGEEDGGGFNSVGGAEWALDVANNVLWAVPAMGRGAWENITAVATRDKDTVAFILADDSSPFDADDYAAEGAGPGNEPEVEAAPLFLYVGEKDPESADFLERNGLADGQLYVLVINNATTPDDFNGTGSKLKGEWVEIDNSKVEDESLWSEDGSTGFDEYGYPTQRTLWIRAEALGAFGFSRPEDVAYNPHKNNEIVLASTGVDTYVGGADTFGTLYTIETNFKKLTAKVEILYDGDDDPTRALRSPDNLDWADDGLIYVQEDEAEEDTLDGEPLFGVGAVNPNEASIVAVNPNNGKVSRVAEINRGVVYDASLDNASDAFDTDFGKAGEWESSGILDVSSLFDEKPGTLFLFDVQAHGIEDQTTKGLMNFASRITDDDLVEGGQLLFLEAPEKHKSLEKDD
jgi:hypothetical protein